MDYQLKQARGWLDFFFAPWQGGLNARCYMPKKIFAFLITALLALGIFGCRGRSTGGRATGTPPANNPPPSVASLNPSNAMAGGAAFGLTVNGSNFIFGSV